MTDTAAEPARPLLLGVRRGLAFKCPECGKGRLFVKYLKVAPTCEVCGHDLSQYRADDGPAYLTILLLGHLVIAPMLFFPIVWTASPWIVMPIALTSLTVVALTALPRIKGGFVGLLWSLRPGEHQH
jgi:uncharacterized protein (DUF983 family)